MKQDEFEKLISRIKAASAEVKELESIVEGMHRADSAALRMVVHSEVEELKSRSYMLNLWVGE